MRPDPEDRDALRLLLGRDDLSDFDAEFVESLRHWRGKWTVKQGQCFDILWMNYFQEA